MEVMVINLSKNKKSKQTINTIKSLIFLIKVFNKRPDTTKDLRDLYFNAQYYHLVHSVALLSVPLVKRPKIVRFFVILIFSFEKVFGLILNVFFF